MYNWCGNLVKIHKHREEARGNRNKTFIKNVKIAIRYKLKNGNKREITKKGNLVGKKLKRGG